MWRAMTPSLRACEPFERARPPISRLRCRRLKAGALYYRNACLPLLRQALGVDVGDRRKVNSFVYFACAKFAFYFGEGYNSLDACVWRSYPVITASDLGVLLYPGLLL